MTKFNFLFFTALSLMMISLSTNAQMPSFSTYGDGSAANNSYADYVGDKAVIVSPSSIAGPLKFTIANDSLGDPTNNWGTTIKSIGTTIQNTDIVKSDPYEACATLTNSSSMKGKVALVKRGNCEFGAKALEAQIAGAIAVIIVNNVSGPPVGMGKGAKGDQVKIPVIMVSDVQGAAIESALASNNATLTFTTWSNGYNNDIGFVNGGFATWHAFSIPLNQIMGSQSNPYKGFDGALVANFGTQTANSTTLKASVYFTPDGGGSKSMINQDSVVVSTPFTPLDSIISPFIDKTYTLNPTTTGRYDVEYELIPDFVDDFPGDNKLSYSFRVDNRIYSKGSYNHADNKPNFAGYSRFANSSDYIWGPMYYMEKGGYGFEHVKLGLAKQDAITNNSMAGQGTVGIYIWKWQDTNGDSVIERAELSVVGVGTKTYVEGDTSGQLHEIVITDPNDKFKQLVTEDTTWYWVSASVPGGLFMPIDGENNMFVRAWGRKKSSQPTREYGAPIYQGGYDVFKDVTSTPNSNNQREDIPSHWPFDRYYSLEDSIRFSLQKGGYIAAIPIQMSLFKVGVDNKLMTPSYDVEIYPNPVTDVMNVNVNLPKEAKTINYTILNSVGEKVSDVTRNNLKKDTYQVKTANLAAGTYYIIINADNEPQSRKFTVIK